MDIVDNNAKSVSTIIIFAGAWLICQSIGRNIVMYFQIVF